MLKKKDKVIKEIKEKIKSMEGIKHKKKWTSWTKTPNEYTEKIFK